MKQHYKSERHVALDANLAQLNRQRIPRHRPSAGIWWLIALIAGVTAVLLLSHFLAR